jgi:hypothetical protein
MTTKIPYQPAANVAQIIRSAMKAGDFDENTPVVILDPADISIGSGDRRKPTVLRPAVEIVRASHDEVGKFLICKPGPPLREKVAVANFVRVGQLLEALATVPDQALLVVPTKARVPVVAALPGMSPVRDALALGPADGNSSMLVLTPRHRRDYAGQLLSGGQWPLRHG